jgi:ABC-type glycerol-3-phosphate transport system substrate-binding protein
MSLIRLHRLAVVGAAMTVVLLLCSALTSAAEVTITWFDALGGELTAALESLYERRYGERLTIKTLPESQFNRRYELADIVFEQVLTGSGSVYEDTLVPLDPYLAMADALGESGLLTASIRAVQQEGSVWLLPITALPIGVLYNMELLEAAGLEQPRPDWTWDEVVSMAAAAQNGLTRNREYGVLIDHTALLLLTGAMGGWIASPDGDAADIRNEGFVQTLDFLAELARKKAVAVAGNQGLFASGRAAMLLCGFMHPLIVDRYEFRFGFAPLPLQPLGATPVIFLGLGLTRASKDPLTAFRVMQLACSPEIEPYYAALGLLPMQESSIDLFAARWGEHAGALYHLLRRPVANVGTPYLHLPQQYFTIVLDGMTRVATGTIGVEECLDYIEPRLTQILSDY